MTNDIQTGLRVPAPAPLDSKLYVLTYSSLESLGASNHLAFSYYKGMTIYCVETDTYYRWREKVGSEVGTISGDFTYPTSFISNGITYSGEVYNFFPLLSADEIAIRNVGEGVGLYKDFITVGTTKYFNLKSIKSNSIIITESEDGNTIVIDLLEASSGIPALNVNKDYSPNYNDFLNYYNNVYLVEGGSPIEEGDVFSYKGEGSFSKPFTDTRQFILGEINTAPVILPNTAIINGLEAYVGEGTPLLPEKDGNAIVVGESEGFYSYPNTFNYSNLKLYLKTSVTCTATGLLLDMDNTSYFNNLSANVYIHLEQGIDLQIANSLGFNNSGNSVTTLPLYVNTRLAVFAGEGEIKCNYNGVDNLTRYIFNGEGGYNNGGLHFQVHCKVSATHQGIYYCKNNMRVDFHNQLTSGTYLGTINTNIKAFHMTGGQVRFYEKGAITLSSETSSRLYGVTFEPTGDGIGNCIFNLFSATVSGVCNYCFVRLNNEAVSFLAFSSNSSYGFVTYILGTNTVTNGLFKNLGADRWQVSFRDNIFSFTGINSDEVDLTQGNNVTSLNSIGSSLILTPVIKQDKYDASLSLPKNSLFLQVKFVIAGAFIIGQQYKITSVGTTDFTLIGAVSNTVGEWFTATGAGTGDGIGALEHLEILT
jgi:hypothetical protein